MKLPYFFLTRISFLILVLCTAIQAHAQDNRFVYPATKKINQTDTFFGYKIEDPYRWLENQNSEETKAWVKKQNDYTQEYLSKIPNRFTLHEQIKRNSEIEYLTPDKKGDYYFVLMPKFDGKEFSIYFKKDLKTDPWEELFVVKDLKVEKEHHISITQYEVSADSKYIAYMFDKNGSDWKELKVADLEWQRSLYDHLYDLKFTDIVWRGKGFYYTRYDRTTDDEQYKQLAVNGKLYYHKLGTPQNKDSLVFKKGEGSSNLFTPVVSENERFMVLCDHDPVNNTNAYFYYDFESKTQTSLLPLFKKSGKAFEFLGTEGDHLVFMTKINNEKKVIAVDPANPLKWVEKIKSIERLNVLDGFYHKDKLYELCMYNEQEMIVIFDAAGTVIKKVEIPFGSACKFKGMDEKSNQLLLSYSSYMHPPVYTGMNLNTFKFELLEKVKISYTMGDYEIEKVTYKSDTAYVPMLLMHKKGLVLDGTNPVLLEYYGGFGSIYEPYYDPGKISFIENGGVYAYAMIRGGGEKGLYWHKAGRAMNRQRSIDDVINGAQYLIDKKYTNPSKLAISGGSHGGMMTGAVVVQRPDLFAAAVPVVGNLDMLRLEKFTAGTFHTDEYGTVKDSLSFLNLRSFSPLHNIKKGTKYPAMLIITSDHDDRVPPLHSYKMTATMQELASKEKPVLLRIEKNAGHNGARNNETYFNEAADFYSFILNALGVKGFK